MPTYDSTGTGHPSPIASVTLLNTENGLRIDDVPMLLDTGADVTLVPRAAIESIGVEVKSDKSYLLTGFDGNESVYGYATLKIMIEGKSFRGAYVVTDDEVGVLGRQVLNNIILVFDGPRLTWNIAKRTSTGYEVG